MKQAVWNGTVIAESPTTVEVEGRDYFPEDSVKKEFLKPITVTTVCPWKGKASYYNIEVDGEVNRGAAWYYPDPLPEAENIRNHVAFWRGVEVQES